MSAIPVPLRLADRPTQGGLVVPYVAVGLTDGTYDFGNLHTIAVNRCLMYQLCQICGGRITGRMVFLVPESNVAALIATEPPLHPECAAYSAKACPMVNGRMPAYRPTPGRTEKAPGKVCAEPECGCGGWITTPGGSGKAGRPAESWHAIWCRDYEITVPDDDTKRLVDAGVVAAGRILGARIPEPLKIRRVTP